MKVIPRLWAYAVITATFLASSVGIVDAGPVRVPESNTIKASDPLYLQSGNAYFAQQNTQSNLQQMYHYSHSSHSSHWSHQSHQSHYSSRY